ncbi:hypothetical protein ACTFIY_006011 [Dictyostelium cf. discoideum]
MKHSYDISKLNIGKNILLTGQTGIIISFHFNQIDIQDSIKVNKVLNQLELNENITNVDSIFHFAFMNDIGDVKQIDMNRLNNAHGAKTIGAINLHNQSIDRSWNIKQFIMASSVVSIFGSDQQCCYVSASSVIDSLSNSLDLFIQNQHLHPNYCLSDFNFEILPPTLTNHFLTKFDYQINIVKKLNQIFQCELLSIDESKINQDLQLTQYGMDSLVIVQLKNFIDNQLGHNIITIQQLQNNKINQSIEIIKSAHNKNNNNNNNNNSNIRSNNIKIEKQSIDEFIKNEIKLNESIISRPYSIKNILNNNNSSSKSIFLTGSTGFLGAYLLTELIKMNNVSKIYCLIRNNSKLTNPIDVIINNLKKHQLIDMNKDKGNISNDKPSENQLIKIIPIIGDISKDKFGLTEQDYLKLSNECDIFINSAADLDLKSNYEESKTVNVNSINQVINLSVSNNNSQKLIVHFSSLSVFINHQFKDGEDFEETNLFPSFNSTPVGYIQCKVISEKLLTNAAESRGIPSIIIRLPDIFPNPITGIGHSNDALSLLIKASKEIGYYPNIHISIYSTPVTTIAKNSINLIFNENSWIQNKSKPISIYNFNGNSMEMKSFYRVLENNFKSFKINSSLKMSNSTKELLISIGFYNHQDWEINESIILNHIINNH